MKSKYPTSEEYIDTLDNKENVITFSSLPSQKFSYPLFHPFFTQQLNDWKHTFERQQAEAARRKDKKVSKENDEFYHYHNIISHAFKEVEENDLKLEVHLKLHTP